MLSKEIQDLLRFYNAGLKLYRERKWDEALASFHEVLRIKPEDGPSQLYVERCQLFKKEPPPEDWDGVFTMTTK